jgi:hypothetical protein
MSRPIAKLTNGCLATAMTAIITTAVFGGVVAVAAPAQAQGAKQDLSAFVGRCVASTTSRGFRPAGCQRVADFARSRYGSQVTVSEWNSAAAVISAKERKGQ